MPIPGNIEIHSPKQTSLRSDTELVAACLAGDLPAWDALIARYQGFLFFLALRMGLSRPDAEDVFQNVCLSLYQNLHTLRDVERLSGWLATAVRQEVWRLGRTRRASPMAEMSDGVDWLEQGTRHGSAEPELPPEERVLAWERQHLVRECLQHVSEPCQRLLTLLYSDDDEHSYADVAALLSIPVGSIGPKRARCLAHLKKLLAEFGF